MKICVRIETVSEWRQCEKRDSVRIVMVSE